MEKKPLDKKKQKKNYLPHNLGQEWIIIWKDTIPDTLILKLKSQKIKSKKHKSAKNNFKNYDACIYLFVRVVIWET